MRPTAVLASALVRPALVLTAVCSARRWLDPEPTMVVECASCRPFCRLLGGEGAEVVTARVTATLPCNPRIIVRWPVRCTAALAPENQRFRRRSTL